jgi:hypothetical protein
MGGYYQMVFSRYHEKKREPHSCSLKMINDHLAHLLPDKQDHFETLAIVRNLYKVSGEDGLKYYKSQPDETLQDIATRIYEERMTSHYENFSPTTVYLDLSRDELINMIMFSDWSKMSDNDESRSILNHAFLQFKNTIAEAKETKNHQIFAMAKQQLIKAIESGSCINIFSLSFRAVVEVLLNNVSDDNKAGKSTRSGTKLEALVNGSFVKASASAGPGGDRLDNFLLKFASELNLELIQGARWDSLAMTLLGPVKDQLVPYVIAVNYQISSQFRSIDGVFTGFLPDVSNLTEQDGQCIPDWVDSYNDVDQTDESPLFITTRKLFECPDCQMFITLEMKHYAENIDGPTVKSVLKKAVTKGREIAKLWPQGCVNPIYHLHLFCVSSLADIKDWDLIRSKCAHVLKILQLTYDSTANSFGFKDLFANTISNTRTAVNKDLEEVAKYPTANASFPHTTVIILSLKDLFGYGLESAFNLQSNAPSPQPEQPSQNLPAKRSPKPSKNMQTKLHKSRQFRRVLNFAK